MGYAGDSMRRVRRQPGAARAAAAGEIGRAHVLGLRFVALERHLSFLETGARS